MSREYVPVFFDWTEVTGELNDQEKGRLIDAIVLYAQGGDWQERIKGNERYLFPAFKGMIDRASEVSRAKSQAATEREQRKAQKAQTNTKSTDEHKKPKKEKEEEEEDKKENSLSDESERKSAKRFSPPTLEDVEEYCGSRNSSVIPEKFIDYYQSIGWKVGGKSQMKDWKAAVRNWEQMNRDKDAAAYDLPL